MILLDTSIWIEYFKLNKDYLEKIVPLLEQKQVCSIDPIFGELTQGAKSKKEIDFITNHWNNIQLINTPNLFFFSGIYSCTEKLTPKGIQLIDAAIIYTAIENNLKLWTLDKKVLKFMDEKYLY